jgi:hypothetical protein
VRATGNNDKNSVVKMGDITLANRIHLGLKHYAVKIDYIEELILRKSYRGVQSRNFVKTASQT